MRRFALQKISRGLVWLCRLDDAPPRIAFGLALGAFVAWTPTVGIQMILVVLLSLLIPFNRAAAILAVYLSNPVSMLPMYVLAYRVGNWFFPKPGLEQQLAEALHDNRLGWWQWLGRFWELMWEFAGPLWLGALMLGALTAALLYWPSLVLIEWLRSRSRRRRRRLQPARKAA